MLVIYNANLFFERGIILGVWAKLMDSEDQDAVLGFSFRLPGNTRFSPRSENDRRDVQTPFEQPVFIAVEDGCNRPISREYGRSED